MAREKASESGAVDYEKVKADLAKSGVAVADIRSFVAGLKRKNEIADLCKQREQLRAELAKVEKKITLLRGEPSVRAPRKARAKRTAKAQVAQVASEQVLAFLKKQKGEKLPRGKIAEGLGVAPAALGDALGSLLAEKTIKKEGEKRGTRYSV